MQKLEHILAEIPLFKGLDQRYLQLIVKRASSDQCNAGEFILREGEEANQFYIILLGKVAIEAVMIPGRESMTIRTLREGDVIGWSWLFPPYRWHFDARAIVPTLVIAVDGKYIRTKCEEDHDFGYELMKRFAQIIVQRLQSMRSQPSDLYAFHS